MNLLKIFVLALLTAATAFSQPPDSGKKPLEATLSALTVLAQGSDGGMEKPFIFVARDKETYSELQKAVKNLPEKVDFSENAVVAAFLGTMLTGGYDISFSEDTLKDPFIGAKLSITRLDPRPGSPVTDALTSPFRVMLIPVEKDKTLKIETGMEWKKSAEVYSVTSGKFITQSIMMPPYFRELQVSGTIEVWRNGGLATCAFHLSAAGAGAKTLEDTASGSVNKNILFLSRVDSGRFVEKPRYPLMMKGNLSAEKVLLEIAPMKSASYGASVRYQGQGKLELVKQK